MSTQLSTDRAVDILCNMIALPTVNPMGNPRRDAGLARGLPVERPLVEYLETLFAPYQAAPHNLTLERQRCNDDHENLLITLPGATNGPATLFESHMDTVPADDWLDGAFQPRTEPGVVIGRGACDDKGPLTSMVIALLDILESGQQPPQTIYLLAAADEESGQTGIKHFANTFTSQLGRGIFGEPTSCLPIIQHKGVVRWDIITHGKSCHSSQPETGIDAIGHMIEVMHKLRQLEQELQREHRNPLLTAPTLTVTRIEGGRTRNALADECKVAVDFRITPGLTCADAYQRVVEAVSSLDVNVTHENKQCELPPLNTSPDSDLVVATTAICSDVLGHNVTPGTAPYGTDACWIPGGSPALVIGPGDIAYAHTNYEQVPIDELMKCATIHHRLMLRDWE